MSLLINFNKTRKVGTIYYPEKMIIRKFVLGKKNQKLIKNEIKGINWYSSLKKNLNINKLIQIEKNFIDMEIIRGKHIRYWNSLKTNYYYAKKVIFHYKEMWPSKEIVPCHGDLTFSNIIFTKELFPCIIDWENFLEKKINWGYDLAYFLISTISLPSIFSRENKFKNKELYLFEQLWNLAFDNKKFDYLYNPISFFKNNFNKTFILRKKNNYYPNLLSKKKINQINEVLNIKN